MLSLAHKISSNVTRVGSLIGQDGDFGGPSLRIDADGATQAALCRDYVDVAWTRNHVDARTGICLVGALNAVSEHGDRLGTADGVDLIDTQ